MNKFITRLKSKSPFKSKSSSRKPSAKSLMDMPMPKTMLFQLNQLTKEVAIIRDGIYPRPHLTSKDELIIFENYLIFVVSYKEDN